jgi:hypothetical protein
MCYVADYEYHHRQRAFKTDPCPAVLSLDGAHLPQSIKNFFRTTIHRKTYCTIYHMYIIPYLHVYIWHKEVGVCQGSCKVLSRLLLLLGHTVQYSVDLVTATQ